MKAKGIWQIYCDGNGCPRNERGHRYRGIVKCYGCDYAYWWIEHKKGAPYGPRKKMIK